LKISQTWINSSRESTANKFNMMQKNKKSKMGFFFRNEKTGKINLKFF
jgi:hypothetical protein